MKLIRIVTSNKYKSLPSSQIVPRLADEEHKYVDSESIMYRVLNEFELNHDHHHSGLNFLTPIQRHNGLSNQRFTNRKTVYQAGKEKNPNRWSKEIRNGTL
jgi:hypothetical protein